MKNIKRLLIPKAIGLGFLILCAILLALASQGNTPEECDITPVVFMAPLGLYFLFG